MKLSTFVASMLATTAPAYGQGATNTVYALYPNDQTMAATGVFFLATIDAAAAQQLAGNYKLLQAPRFAPGTHPALVWQVFNNDIRQNALAIPSLKASQILIPYIDRLNDGTTPFSRTVQGFIAGTNGNRLGGQVPALVGTAASAGGYPLFSAIIDPDDKAYASINGRQFYANVKLEIAPNDVSGPGVTPPAVDFLFEAASSPKYPLQQVNGALNQPAILPTGQCRRANYRFNETFADPRPAQGTVKFYSPVVPAALSGSSDALNPSARTYNAAGFTATAELIVFNAEDCASAAKNVIVV